MNSKNYITTAIAVGLVVAAAAPSAHADTLYAGCTITNVAWDNYDGPGNQLGFICSGSAGWAYARTNTTSSGCYYSNTVDTLKSWLSLLQAALLSGHHINFNYASAGSHCNLLGGAYEVTRVELVP